MRVLIPLEDLEAEQKRRAESRRESGGAWNRRDTVAVLLAAVILLAGALLLFAPLRQADYRVVGNFSLQEQAAPVNINTAQEQALCSLPGIGPKKAAAIREYIRQNGPFESLEQAAQVPGISAAMVEKWQGLATAE